MAVIPIAIKKMIMCKSRFISFSLRLINQEAMIGEVSRSVNGKIFRVGIVESTMTNLPFLKQSLTAIRQSYPDIFAEPAGYISFYGNNIHIILNLL
jgi:hypothetical protein